MTYFIAIDEGHITGLLFLLGALFLCGAAYAAYKKKSPASIISAIDEKIKTRIKNWLAINMIGSNVPKSTCFPHKNGIFISASTKIGENCRIYQNVTIGRKSMHEPESESPTIGNNVVIYAGAVVIGKITVGNNAVIGANSVVTRDVGENERVKGRTEFTTGTAHASRE